MTAHLLMDAVAGMLLGMAPWVFGFARSKRTRTWLPYVAVTAAEAAVIALTQARDTR